MNQISEIELEEIKNKLNKLEIKWAKDDWKSSWWWLGNNWPDKQTCLTRKASLEVLKKDIERKINLIDKENALLLSKFSTQLLNVEEKISKLEVKLSGWQDKEKSNSILIYFILTIFIILLIFVLYMFGSGKWKRN